MQIVNENDNSGFYFINSLISEISSIKSKDNDSTYGEIESLIKKIEIYILLDKIKVPEISFVEHRKQTSISNSLIEILENKSIEELEKLKIQGKKDLLKFLVIENLNIIESYDENKLTIYEFEIVLKSYNDFIKNNKEKSHSNYINFSNFENFANKFYIDDFEKICKNYFKADFIAQNYINNNLSKLNINQILIILECKDQSEINFVIDKTSETSNEYNEKSIFETKQALLEFRKYYEYDKYKNFNLNTNYPYPSNSRNNDVSPIGKNIDTGSTVSSIGSFPKSNNSFNSNTNNLIISKKFCTDIYTSESLLQYCKILKKGNNT